MEEQAEMRQSKQRKQDAVSSVTGLVSFFTLLHWRAQSDSTSTSKLSSVTGLVSFFTRPHWRAQSDPSTLYMVTDL